MLRDLIDEFRARHETGAANFCDPQEDQYCFWHCLHMARVGGGCHAPDVLRNGKAEAVGWGGFYRDTRESLARIFYGDPEHGVEGFAQSPEHTKILLLPNISCAMAQENWHVYITVRGWS